MAKSRTEYVWTFERDWLGWRIALKGLKDGIEVALTKEEPNGKEETVDGTGGGA